MIQTDLAVWIEKAPVLAASMAAVLFMAGFAALLGFRQRARIDDAQLVRFAAAEHLSVEGAIISSDAKTALARLEGGKLLIARVMGADVSTRVVSAASARVRRRNGKLSVAFADTGFPPLHMKVQEPPSWLAELGEAR